MPIAGGANSWLCWRAKALRNRIRSTSRIILSLALSLYRESFGFRSLTHIDDDEVWSLASDEVWLQSLEYTRASWTQAKSLQRRKVARGSGTESITLILSAFLCVGVSVCSGAGLYLCARIITSRKCEQLKVSFCFRPKMSFYLLEIKANPRQSTHTQIHTHTHICIYGNVNVCHGPESHRIRYGAASSSSLSDALRHFSIFIYFILFLISSQFFHRFLSLYFCVGQTLKCLHSPK